MKLYLIVGAMLLMMVHNTNAESLLLEEKTWPEIDAAINAGTDTVIVTIGATEQHGPQIALASDSVTGDHLAAEIARKIGRTLVAPNIRVGLSSHHMYFPGTISVRGEVISNLVIEYVHSLVWHGFRHVIIIPTHGGNFRTVRDVGQKLSWLYPHVNVMAFSDADGYINTMMSTSRRLNISPEIAGSHAGMSETSMVLAARPDLVRMDKSSVGFMGDAYGAGEKMNEEGTSSVSPIGVLGDPRHSSAEAGREYLSDLVDFLAAYAQTGRERWKGTRSRTMPFGGLAEPQGPLADGIRARREGYYDRAKEFFEAELNARPTDIDARTELARTLVLGGSIDHARAVIIPLLKVDDTVVLERAHDELALIDLYQGRFNSAIEHKKVARQLTASGKRHPEHEARKLLYIGYIANETGQLEIAAASYAKGLELVPSASDVNLDLQHLLGLLEIKQGRLHKAGARLRMLGDAVFEEKFSSQIRRFYHLNAELLMKQGRPDDALVNIPLAIQSYDHPLYRETLARAYIAVDRLADAEAELLEIINLTDARLDIPIHYIKAHYQLATLYHRLNRPDEARQMYSKFLSFWGDTDIPVSEVVDATTALSSLAGTASP